MSHATKTSILCFLSFLEARVKTKQNKYNPGHETKREITRKVKWEGKRKERRGGLERVAE
jgi:hypothetical protein